MKKNRNQRKEELIEQDNQIYTDYLEGNKLSLNDSNSLFQQGFKITYPSGMIESKNGIRSWSTLGKPITWKRYYYTQMFRGEKRESIHLKLNVDLPLSAELFDSLVILLKNPRSYPVSGNFGELDASCNLFNLDDPVKLFDFGKLFGTKNLILGNHLKEYEKSKSLARGQREVDEIYSYLTTLAGFNARIDGELAKLRLSKGERIPEFRLVNSDQDKDPGLGLSYSPEKPDIVNLEIKFAFRNPKLKIKKVHFHTGDHPERALTLNIHLVRESNSFQGIINDINGLSDGIGCRLKELKNAFFCAGHYKALMCIKDFEYIKFYNGMTKLINQYPKIVYTKHDTKSNRPPPPPQPAMDLEDDDEYQATNWESNNQDQVSSLTPRV